ncbi:GntR family transcriptional regulator [Kocuria sp.]|uniref:GntR family transcriptional regulator n=1 Tax=Kocuria sp. TaxID=1871328 RepID=UPI0028AF6CAE|nr:GntR family transcriptional regulator [Kocuria sp.]
MDGQAGEAYARLEKLIVFGELEPGSLVSEKRLMELIELGRTPVREAIQSLSRHRMVRVYPSKGILIPPISVEDQFNLLVVRRPLETTAVRLAALRRGTAYDNALGGLIGRLSSPLSTLDDYADLLGDAHHTVAAAANNPYLSDAIAPLQSLSRRFWFHHVVDAQQEIEMGAELLGPILRGVMEREPTLAENASLALNDYLVGFTQEVVNRSRFDATAV